MRSKEKSVTPLFIFSAGFQLPFHLYQTMKGDVKNLCENLAEFCMFTLSLVWFLKPFWQFGKLASKGRSFNRNSPFNT